MTTNHQEDRSLVRRLNFLGFPEEKRGGLSYAGLKAELGDDNAAKLVTRIEELLIKQGLESLGVPLSSALSRIVQSLTPDERRHMAQDGVVPAHVQTRVSAEIATAKLQQLQTPKNIHAAGLVTDKAPSEKPLGTISNRGGNQFAELSDKSKPVSGAPATSNPEFLRSLGLDYGTASKLAGLGFSTPEQVRQIVGDTKSLGLSDKGAVLDVARLKKDSGERFEGHKKSLQSYREELEAASKEERAAETETDPQKQAEHRRRAQEIRKAAEERADHHRDHETKTRQERKSYDNVRDRVRNDDKQKTDLHNRNSTHLETQQDRMADNRKVGIEQRVESKHRVTVAKADANPERMEADTFAALEAGLTKAPEGKPSQLASTPAETTQSGAKSASPKAEEKPERPKREASNQKGLNPTV